MSKLIDKILKKIYPTEKFQQSDELIPNGEYCYYGLSTGYYNAKFIYLTKNCPYYKHLFWQDNLSGYCTLVHCEIEDKCKACSIK